MTGRLAPVLLAVLLLLAGCSQLASAPNEQTETTTVAGTDMRSPTPSPTTEPTASATANATANATAAANTTTAGPIQGQAPTSSTPTATATTTATPTAASTTGTPSPTATPSLEPHFVVIIGGSPDDKVRYDFSVTGTIERRGQSYGAPIDDGGVTRDPDIDIISPNGSSVSGRLGGGGDAYRITGEITEFEAADEDAVDVYVDGERIETDD